ncbi:hypothetical protein KIL84_015745 [Mauremys mutica]|uniref:Uncharacterized protein n=1 Tax=Mauremys mutica TaxID=74926 RepID=A0A9D4APY7_9SAUR|nr:hypothetical protein KIL84_015745 [Mauremys mutica]
MLFVYAVLHNPQTIHVHGLDWCSHGETCKRRLMGGGMKSFPIRSVQNRDSQEVRAICLVSQPSLPALAPKLPCSHHSIRLYASSTQNRAVHDLLVACQIISPPPQNLFPQSII